MHVHIPGHGLVWIEWWVVALAVIGVAMLFLRLC
jgi:hypothetical protein